MNGRSADPLIGAVLGGAYRITDLLGEGGMGCVYAAEHLRLPRRLAVKVLRDAVEPGSEAFLRFRREAELCCRLEHPNIVQVFDFDTTPAGRPYLVMEHLEGEDLATLLGREGPLPPTRALELLAPVCSGLGRAHAAGIVHRDLKPQNVFLAKRQDGPPVPKLLDFGISKLRDASTVLTRDGALLGTPSYMSPEQFRGESGQVDLRSDLYSLGVLAYEMLSGRRPFDGTSLARLVYQLSFEEAPRLSTVNPGLGTALDPVLARLLHKDPAARYGSADEVRAAFAAAASTREPERTPSGESPARETIHRTAAPPAPVDVSSSSAWSPPEASTDTTAQHASAEASPRPAPAPGLWRRRVALAVLLASGIGVGAFLLLREEGTGSGERRAAGRRPAKSPREGQSGPAGSPREGQADPADSSRRSPRGPVLPGHAREGADGASAVPKPLPGTPMSPPAPPGEHPHPSRKAVPGLAARRPRPSQVPPRLATKPPVAARLQARLPAPSAHQADCDRRLAALKRLFRSGAIDRAEYSRLLDRTLQKHCR